MQRPTTWLYTTFLVVTLSTSAWAHPAQQPATRQLVRLQGYRTSETPAGTTRRFEVNALGRVHPFAAGDWQIFAFAGDDRPDKEQAADGVQRVTLQGSREEVARFAAARPDQRVTVLAERRPGAADLFLLTLDLCPPQ